MSKAPLSTWPKETRRVYAGLQSYGTIDTIGSDHAPFTHAEKDAGIPDIWNAPNGLTGIQTMVPLVFSEGVLGRGLSLERFADLFAENAARIFGLGRKGRIAVGADADFRTPRSSRDVDDRRRVPRIQEPLEPVPRPSSHRQDRANDRAWPDGLRERKRRRRRRLRRAGVRGRHHRDIGRLTARGHLGPISPRIMRVTSVQNCGVFATVNESVGRRSKAYFAIQEMRMSGARVELSSCAYALKQLSSPA